jgi:hypothetical protein
MSQHVSYLSEFFTILHVVKCGRIAFDERTEMRHRKSQSVQNWVHNLTNTATVQVSGLEACEFLTVSHMVKHIVHFV